MQRTRGHTDRAIEKVMTDGTEGGGGWRADWRDEQ